MLFLFRPFLLRRIFFSSLINEQMRIKGESVGADGQFSKPQIGQLIQYLDEHI